MKLCNQGKIKFVLKNIYTLWTFAKGCIYFFNYYILTFLVTEFEYARVW